MIVVENHDVDMRVVNDFYNHIGCKNIEKITVFEA